MSADARKIYHSLLRFVLRHKSLNNSIGKTKWFKRMVDEEAHWIIRNLKYTGQE